MSRTNDFRKRAADALETTLNKAVDVQWKRAQAGVASKRRRRPTDSADDIADRIIRDFVRDITAIGATSGGIAAVPGAGTTVRVTAGLTAESTLLLERATFMTLAVAHAYGHDLTDVHVRKYAVLRVLAVWAGAANGMLRFNAAVAQGLGKKAVRGIPAKGVFAINRAVGKRVLVKWGTKSGAVRLGSVVPFGFGFGLGAAGNFWMAKGLGKAAKNEFS